ncbi:MAG: potassium/proton antiporter [Gemmatimonadota bacterium]|jgi:cell volume regulation protein A|nr:potassium/proton antiporter [Gemmatimonadota bacterium]
MFLVDHLILIGSLLLLVGIVSSKFSVRLGVPVLVLFLGVGMLAGEGGPGGIAFHNLEIAHAVGTMALAAILFDGGIQTPLDAIRGVWKPASLLATAGVLVTSAITGIAAAYILDLSLLQGALLGSIVASTDAAAVFSSLRTSGIHLRKRVEHLLEMESALNDPMAIFLTIGIVEILRGEAEIGPGLLGFFIQQMGIGAVVGLGVGFLSTRLINRINLESAGLYPVLTGTCGMFAFGVAAALEGSGFLAVFLCGAVIGNSRIVFQRASDRFLDAIAWIGQIVMFVVLGLLVTPGQLLEVAGPGLLISGVLILVARPLAVAPFILPFGFNWRETLLVSWVGLRGSVPIILAIFPLLFGLPPGQTFFSIVFFVVLISATVQGSTLAFFTRKLDLEEESEPEAPVTLEITALHDVDAEIVEYSVGDDSRAAGRKLSQLSLPNGVVVAMISRERTLIPPRGSSMILSGDHVFVVLRSETRPLVDRVFSRGRQKDPELPATTEFPLFGSVTVEDLADFYGIELPAPGAMTLDELIRDRLGNDAATGRVVQMDGVMLHVLEMVGRTITVVGLIIPEMGNDLS